ncbi:TfoX/Sxy family protein [Sphingomonas endophytica]|uniref:Competence protein TfoX n=1 Tax=Sphingomonas endophytica TaxID=869719 RepID=A0A147I8L7_9SPHN|nr:TfoX/Sxy family protein [Sphingomonas endophytica]KTT75551.1 competence protein TfoX [Sphingomonas endophytica]
MALDHGLIDWIAEALAAEGVVTHRRMMGGATLYLDGTVFAIVGGDGGLWFKGDAESDATWDAAGCARFTHERGDGTIASMNYRRAPEDCYDDAEAAREWALLGVAAGRRAPAKKKPSSRRKRASS